MTIRPGTLEPSASGTATVQNPYAQLKTGPRVRLADQVPLRGPLSVYVEPTNICNFKCVFCPESFSNYEEKAGGLFQMKPHDFERVAEQIGRIGTVKTLNFYMMGEPFVNRSLLDYVRLAKREGICDRVIVTSNGTLIGPKLYQGICESGLDFLRVSIYGATEAHQAANTQSVIKLQRIIDNIRGLREFRDANGFATPHIYVKMIDAQDDAQNEVFLETFREVGDEVAVEPRMNWNDPEEGSLAKIETQQMLGTDYFAQRKQACPFPFYMAVIHADLNVSVCCVDWDKKVVVGNLREQSLEEIWAGEKLRAFQMLHLERRRSEIDGCRNCTYLHTARDSIDTLSPDTFRARLAART